MAFHHIAEHLQKQKIKKFDLAKILYEVSLAIKNEAPELAVSVQSFKGNVLTLSAASHTEAAELRLRLPRLRDKINEKIAPARVEYVQVVVKIHQP